MIYEVGAVERTRDRVVQYCAAIADRLARRREMLDSGWSWDEQAFVDGLGYDPWSRDSEKAVEAAESLLTEPRGYGVHLQGLTHLGLQSAVSDARRAA